MLWGNKIVDKAVSKVVAAASHGVSLLKSAWNSVDNAINRASAAHAGAAGAPKLLPAPTGYNPWKGPSISTTAAEDLTMYRVWGGDSKQVGAWLSPVRPESASAAKAGLALPDANAAAFVSEVRVPAGTRFQIGVAGPANGQPGGALQVQLLDGIPASSYGAGTGF